MTYKADCQTWASEMTRHKDALKLHNAARAAQLSAADWLAALLSEGPLNVLPTREPFGRSKPH